MNKQQWRRQVQASLLRNEARNDQFWAQLQGSSSAMATVRAIADLGVERARKEVGNDDLFEAVVEAMANKIAGDAVVRRLRLQLELDASDGGSA
ncbi:MAG: hypothetical protein ACOCTI_04530 [Phycisphaeraceae bacterium]